MKNLIASREDAIKEINTNDSHVAMIEGKTYNNELKKKDNKAGHNKKNRTVGRTIKAKNVVKKPQARGNTVNKENSKLIIEANPDIRNLDLIHPTAVIEYGAKIGANVSIGAYSYIGSNVVIHDNAIIKNHASISGHVEIGSHSIVYPFATIGGESQDKKIYRGPSKVVIGSHTIVREYATIHSSTQDTPTTIGNYVLIMSNVHIAHDCTIEDHAVISTGVGLAGHIHVHSYAIIGGMSGVHQFTRIGKHAFVGAMSAINRDILPYNNISERNIRSGHGINLVGMRRNQFTNNQIDVCLYCYEVLNDKSLLFNDKVEVLLDCLNANLVRYNSMEFAGDDLQCLADIVAFLNTKSKRGFEL